MKVLCAIGIWLCALAAMADTAAAQAAPDSLMIDHFLRLNDRGDFEAAWQMLPESMRGRVTTATLSRVWQRATTPVGTYRRIIRIREEVRDTVSIAELYCAFERGFLSMRFVVNTAHKPIGFHVHAIDSVAAPGSASGRMLIKVPEGRIGASLQVPTRGKKMPAALIIPTSGPVDRDGNQGIEQRTDCYRMLADSLAARGIASLRYDKRFVGASAEFSGSAEHITMQDFVSDAVALLQFLKKDRRFSKVVAIGHGEGSLVGMLASQKEAPDAFISVAGAGEPVDRLIEWRFVGQPGMTLDLQGRLKILLDSLRQDRLVYDLTDPLKTLFNPGVQRFLMTEFKYDPSWEIRRLHMPVLVIAGGHDLQTPPGQAQKLHDAKPGVRLEIIPRMNHVLKDAPEGREENLKTYVDPALPLDTTLVHSIASFINGAP